MKLRRLLLKKKQKKYYKYTIVCPRKEACKQAFSNGKVYQSIIQQNKMKHPSNSHMQISLL